MYGVRTHMPEMAQTPERTATQQAIKYGTEETYKTNLVHETKEMPAKISGRQYEKKSRKTNGIIY